MTGRNGAAETPVWYCGRECAGRALQVDVSLGAAPPTQVFVVPPERIVYRDRPPEPIPDDSPLNVPDAIALLNLFAGVRLNLQTITPVRVRTAIERACQRILADVDAWQAEQDRRRPSHAEVQAEAATGAIRHDVPREVLEQEGWRTEADAV